MYTKLPRSIKTVKQAKHFLSELCRNNESYHPDDNAHDINWNPMPAAQRPTPKECDRLNKLMGDIFEPHIVGPIDPDTKNYSNFCPYEFTMAFDDDIFCNEGNRYSEEVALIKAGWQVAKYLPNIKPRNVLLSVENEKPITLVDFINANINPDNLEPDSPEFIKVLKLKVGHYCNCNLIKVQRIK